MAWQIKRIIPVIVQHQESTVNGIYSSISIPVSKRERRCLFRDDKSKLDQAVKRTTKSGFLFESDCAVSRHVVTTETELVLNAVAETFMTELSMNTVTLLINYSLCFPSSSFKLLRKILSSFLNWWKSVQNVMSLSWPRKGTISL